MADCTGLARWSARALAAAIGLVLAGPALAVDLPPAPTLPPISSGSDEFSGWYLRGDLGAGFETAPRFGATGAPVLPGVGVSPSALASYRSPSLTPSGTIDAGVGYVFNTLLRMDATLEYRFGGRLQSTFAVADPGFSGPLGSLRAFGQMSGGVSSIVALVNGYVDLGTYWGATPFVGAGIGVADNAVSGVSAPGYTFTGAGAAVPFSNGFSNASRTNVAWALMAGLDFDIAPNLKLEVSYRYLNLGAVAFGGAHCGVGAACVGAVSSRGTLASNDVRIGLVWLMGDAPAAPAPIVARD